MFFYFSQLFPFPSRYSPIIPLLVQKTASYSLLVEGVTGISSVRTNLESQSLMLAYGGPDIFFSRIGKLMVSVIV